MGLYTVEQEKFSRGDLVVIDLQGSHRRLLESAGALKPGHFLIKPVAAVAEDVVCRAAAKITINEIPVARARTVTPSGIPLPAWSGCRKLSGGEILLIADHPASFDSRYFGPLPVTDVVGVARPLALLPSLQESH
jgi:type IV secretory pathway protease TraF